LDRLKPVQLSGYRDVGRRSATIGVRVPKDCPVEVTSVSAPVVAAGLTGKVQLRTASGDVTADDLGGELEVNTVSGNLSARNLRGRPSLHRRRRPVAPGRGGPAAVSAKAASAQPLAGVDLADSARVRLASISGDVALRLPSDTSA